MPTISKKTREILPLRIDPFIDAAANLTAEETGAFCLLLAHLWRQGGQLMDRDRILASLCMVSLRTWQRRVRPAVEPFFIVEDGVWRHRTIDRDLMSREDLSSKRLKAAQARHRKVLGKLNSAPTERGSHYPSAPHEAEPFSKKVQRRRLIEALGGDPKSGLIGTGGRRAGGPEDMAEAAKWTEMGLSFDQQVAVIRKAMAEMGAPPECFAYFTGAMKQKAKEVYRPDTL